MALMQHKAGTALKTGISQITIAGVHAQSSSKNSAGELKFYHKADGSDLAAYVSDPHKEISFEAVIEATAPEYGIGDLATIGNKTYIITAWNITETNDDVNKVSGTMRETTLTAPSASPAPQS